MNSIPSLLSLIDTGHRGLLVLSMATVVLCTSACMDKTLDSGSDTAGECADEDLPPCPDECPEDWASTCGEACEVDGETCGNEIGDGRECIDGIWECTVHGPLDEGCNQVCDPDA
jgi:hypothetical protein